MAESEPVAATATASIIPTQFEHPSSAAALDGCSNSPICEAARPHARLIGLLAAGHLVIDLPAPRARA